MDKDNLSQGTLWLRTGGDNRTQVRHNQAETGNLNGRKNSRQGTEHIRNNLMSPDTRTLPLRTYSMVACLLPCRMINRTGVCSGHWPLEDQEEKFKVGNEDATSGDFEMMHSQGLVAQYWTHWPGIAADRKQDGTQAGKEQTWEGNIDISCWKEG